VTSATAQAANFFSLEDALRLTAETYLRATWDNQPAYVEVWLEKGAVNFNIGALEIVWIQCRSRIKLQNRDC
jgi:hypothetical protein